MLLPRSTRDSVALAYRDLVLLGPSRRFRRTGALSPQHHRKAGGAATNHSLKLTTARHNARRTSLSKPVNGSLRTRNDPARAGRRP